MKGGAAFGVLVGLMSLAWAGPSETAIVAAMKLSEQPNYSWVATVTDDARTYDIVGQTGPEGFSAVKMPAINALRRRLGRSVTDTEIEFIFRGNVAYVLKHGEHWKLPGELPAAGESEASGDSVAVSGSVPGGTDAGPVLRIPLPPKPDRKAEPRTYSNLQVAVSLPHDELGVIVSSHDEFKVDGEVVSGTLTDLGAQLLLVRDGQSAISPVRAAGTFKLWLRDGLVTRYQVRLEGVLSIDSPAGRRDLIVHQHTDTQIKNVGATVFDVPAEARTKLSR